MAKAKFTTSKGTIVDVDGTPEEIQKFLVIYESTTRKDLVPDKKEKKKIKIEQKKTDTGSKDYILQIVNTIKDCDEAKAIEENIIDRNSQVDKVLLPLYIVHEHMSNEVGLQSGEISKITGDLGIRIKQPNVSKILSETASRYVMGDKVRKAGQAVKYRLNRKGLKYIKGIITGKQDE
jgi:hypothetical protein